MPSHRAMSSSRPFVMRALYEWILENQCTPYVVVDARAEGVDVPRQYVTDGRIVLNISPASVVDLEIGNESLRFNGRFGGIATDVRVPVGAVTAIYARENGQGMVFEEEGAGGPPRGPSAGGGERRPSLRVVK